MDISWDDAQTLLAIAEGGSMSAGAKQLGLGQPTVSRRVAQMEARLGTPLFTRGQQGVALTDAGARLRPAAEQMARWAGEFERIARGAESEATGTVRVAAPPGVAVDWLPQIALEVRETHPALRLEIVASVDYVDLPRGEADLAIRTRPPNEPELMTLASGESPLGVFGARSYVEALQARRRNAGREGNPGLEEIDWVTWSRPYEHVAPRPMLERAIPDFRPSFASDSFLVLRAAVTRGLGAMILDRHGAATTRSGEDALLEIDLGFTLPPNAFHLVCAKSMQFVPRVQVVAQRLVSTLESLTTSPAEPKGTVARKER